jgi:UDP:flavonoid glycosyltransferase YjiC (YdhE family)
VATFVFLNLPARGHINPTLPIVNELATGGHGVHYFTAEEYRRIVEAAGATFHLLPALQRIGSAEVIRAARRQADRHDALRDGAAINQSGS